MPRHTVSDPKIQYLRRTAAFNPHAERIQDPLFGKGDFFDPRDLLQVRYEMVRRVRTEGKSVRETVDAFGVTKPTFYQNLRRLQQGGLPGLLPQKRGPHQGHKLTEEVVRAIREARQKDPSLTPRDLARQVESRFGRRVHPRSIARALGKKNPARRRSPRSPPNSR